MASSPSSFAGEDAFKEYVHKALKKQKIKLWLEPYVRSEAALEDLIKKWKNDEDISEELASEANHGRLLRALKEFQAHSLAKYLEKQQQKNNGLLQSPNSVASPRLVHAGGTVPPKIDLVIKLLGVDKEITTKELKQPSFAERVEFVDKKPASANSITSNTPSAVLCLQGVSTHSETAKIVQYLQESLGVYHMRLIYRGKNIASSAVVKEEKAQKKPTSRASNPSSQISLTIAQALRNASQTTPLSNEISVLCIVSKSVPADDPRMSKHRDTHARISAIRSAALQIRDTTNLEITDQHGSAVPMTKEDRMGFLTALALHRLGRNSKEPEEAIVFLVEADAEWSSHPKLKFWAERVDNYGLLQLDIAWVYLQLESLSNLPDSLRRLEEAERVLRKQVNVNFITLALTQADLGNFREVPPLAAVFAKLFLLQGVAHLYDNSTSKNEASLQKGKERLDWAYSLLQSLRSVATDESVQTLIEAMSGNDVNAVVGFGLPVRARGVARSAAIAALRKARGDINEAANALAQDVRDRRQRQMDREVQRQYGLCQNKQDPVNLEKLEMLKPMLQRPDTPGADSELPVGLLRIANNDVNRALEIFQEQQYDARKVHDVVEELDQQLYDQGLLSRSVWSRNKRRRYNVEQQLAVNEEALATLISMGVETKIARKALLKSNNDIERAQMWLFTAGSQPDMEHDEAEDKKEEQEQDASRMKEDEAPAGEDAVEAKETSPTGWDEVHATRDTGNAEETTEPGDDSEGASSDARKEEEEVDEDQNALELLQQELGGILEERDIEKEYLGSSLDEEWTLLMQYRP